MKILCTGAAGFIGSNVVDLLLKGGHQVWCIDNLSTGKRENLPKKIEFAKVDVGNWFDLVSEFVDCEPEAVIHLAAQPSLDESFDNPIRDGYVNVMGTLNVLRASQKIGVKRIVFASTSAVYAGDHSMPIPEYWDTIPNSPYGISKLAAESYLRTLMPDTSVVLRFGNVYGGRQVPIGENQVIPKMILHFEKGEKFYIHGDGEQMRDYIHVDDVACACLDALESPPGVFNIGYGAGVTVNTLASLLAKIYNVPDYKWEHDDKKDTRGNIELDISKARKIMNWEPNVTLYDGLQKTVAWWKAQ